MTAVTAYGLQMHTIPFNTTLYYFFQSYNFIQCYMFRSITIVISRSLQTFKNQV